MQPGSSSIFTKAFSATYITDFKFLKQIWELREQALCSYDRKRKKVQEAWWGKQWQICSSLCTKNLNIRGCLYELRSNEERYNKEKYNEEKDATKKDTEERKITQRKMQQKMMERIEGQSGYCGRPFWSTVFVHLNLNHRGWCELSSSQLIVCHRCVSSQYLLEKTV